MAVRIRLQRHGRKGRPFYYIVAADARAKRDGRFIERFGSYNPMTNPATINLDSDRALSWLDNGAEMSDTARAILQYRGVLYKHHLAKGVRKGALTEDQAEAKYNQWLADKESRVNANIDNIAKADDAERTARLKAEKAVSDARAAEIAAANAPAPVVEAVAESETVVEEAAGEVAESAEAATEAVEEVAEAAEEVAEEATEAAAEVVEEATEAAEEVVAEATEAAEEAAEEAGDAPAEEEDKA